MKSRCIRQDGMTLIELMIVVLIAGLLLVLATIAVIGARASGNEASAIGSLRAINAAQAQYAATCGRGGYATSLPMLGRPAPGGKQAYLEPDLATGVRVLKAGYWITSRTGYLTVPVQVLDCHGNLPLSSYYATASPGVESEGRRAFATSQAALIWQMGGTIPPAEPFGPPATVIK
jgi:type IV pilus assembly protein PilA